MAPPFAGAGDSVMAHTLLGMSNQQSSTSMRRVAFASSAGTTIESYDFFIYGTAGSVCSRTRTPSV